MFLNYQQVTEEIKREIKKFLEKNDNEHTTTQNLWDEAEAVLRGNFIAIQSYLKKKEKHRIDNLPTLTVPTNKGCLAYRFTISSVRTVLPSLV